MKTYLNIIFNSEGANPIEVVERPTFHRIQTIEGSARPRL